MRPTLPSIVIASDRVKPGMLRQMNGCLVAQLAGRLVTGVGKHYERPTESREVDADSAEFDIELVAQAWADDDVYLGEWSRSSSTRHFSSGCSGTQYSIRLTPKHMVNLRKAR